MKIKIVIDHHWQVVKKKDQRWISSIFDDFSRYPKENSTNRVEKMI